jgi:hypothetical protein
LQTCGFIRDCYLLTHLIRDGASAFLQFTASSKK